LPTATACTVSHITTARLTNCVGWAPNVPSDVLPSTLEAEAQVARFADHGGRGVVVRMGQFYGPDRYSREVLRMARRGIGIVLGDRDAYQSSVWIDDAAAAVTAVVNEPIPSGTYDVVDDEPLRRRELLAVLPQVVGRRRLWRIPGPLARLMAGVMAGGSTRSQRVSNRRFRDASDWAPAVPTGREGWRLLATEFADIGQSSNTNHARTAGMSAGSKVGGQAGGR
jgi:nucleoside-diphosphate-sugar epimerase